MEREDIKKLNRISLDFLKNSRFLTASCIVCVFFVSAMLILMFQLTRNSKKSYLQNMRETFGDCDIIAAHEDYSRIDDKVLKKVSGLDGISELNTGIWDYIDMKTALKEKNSVSIYTIGTDNGRLNRARYKFYSRLKDNLIVINQKFADSQNLKVGDAVYCGTKKFTVSEIIYDDNFSFQNIYFAVITKKAFSGIKNEDISSSYMLIKTKHSKKMSNIKNAVKSADKKLDITMIEDSKEYQSYVKVYSSFMNILAVIVIIISLLFIAAVFRRFMQKYSRDMAVMRTMGASIGQVKMIFSLLGVYITGVGCLLGFVFSVLAGKILFGVIGNEFDLVAEARNVDISLAFGIMAAVFAVVEIFLTLFSKSFINKLPYQSMKNDGSSNKAYSGKGIINRFISAVLPSDMLISYKMAVPKMKENFFMIFTIIMLTVFTYCSEDLMDEIGRNNEIYYKNIYTDDVLIQDEQSHYYSKLDNLCKKIQKHVDTNVFLQSEIDAATGITARKASGKQFFFSGGTSFASLKNMQKSGLVKSSISDFAHSILISRKAAKDYKLKVGDKLVLSTDDADFTDYDERMRTNYKMWEGYKGVKTTVTVVGVIPDSTLASVIIDTDSTIFISFPKEMAVAEWKIFAHKMTKKLDMSLQNARMEFTALRWQSFEQIMAFSHKILKQRYFIVRFTLYMLSVMAGIGWVNAAANMIQSRRKEYVVLRKLGMSEGRVKKIIWYQLVLFIFSGIVAGIVLGIEILKIFHLREYGVWMDIKFRTENIWFILVLFLVLLVSLRKNVRENVAVQA